MRFTSLVRLPLMAILTLLMSIMGITAPQNMFAFTWVTPLTEFAFPEGFNGSLATDSSGNSFTVFRDGPDLFASLFSADLGDYEPPVLLYTSFTFSYRAAPVAMDASGTALVLFAVDSDLMSAYYDGASWITPLPFPLATDLGTFESNFRVTMDGLGNGLAVWVNDVFGVEVSFFDGGTQSWSTPEIISPSDAVDALSVAYSSNGTAVVTWTGNYALPDVIVSNYDGAIWSAPAVIGSLVNDFSQPPRLAAGMDSAGNALALWANGLSGGVFSSYFTGGSWGAPVNISMSSLFLDNVYSFGMAPGGTAVVAWIENGTNDTFYNTFSGGTWSAATFFAVTSDIAVGLDAAGNALMVWTDDVTFDIYSTYLPLGGPHGPPDLIDDSGAGIRARMAGLSNGRGFFNGFLNTGEISGVWGTYTELLIDGTACFDPNTLEWVYMISWMDSEDTDVVAYHLQRNGVTIATFLAPSPGIYYDYDRDRDVLDMYSVIPVNSNGEETGAKRELVM